MNKESKPSLNGKRLQLVEASKKRLVFRLPPLGGRGFGYGLLIYVIFLVPASVMGWQNRQYSLSDLLLLVGMAVFWLLAVLGAYGWVRLRGETKLVIVEPFRLISEVALGRRRTSESIELGATPWAELILFREHENRGADYEVRVHGENGYLDLVLGLPTEEDEWLVVEINRFLQTVDPIEAVGQPWKGTTSVLDSDLGPPPGRRIQIQHRSANRVTIDIKRGPSQPAEEGVTFGAIAVGMPLAVAGWLLFTNQGIVAPVIWIGGFVWIIAVALFIDAIQDRWSWWRLDVERAAITVQSGFLTIAGKSRQIHLLPGTRAELVVKSVLNREPQYAVELTSPLRQLQFGNSLSLVEQFWLVKAINRMLRVTTASPFDLSAGNLDAFELAPEDLPRDSPLQITESTNDQLVVKIPLFRGQRIRNIGIYSILAGMVVLFSLLGLYQRPILIFEQTVPFTAAAVCLGLILAGMFVQFRTDVVVSDLSLICRRGIGPFCFATKIPLDTIRYVGVVRLMQDESGSEVPIRPRVRRPTLYHVTCGIGSSRDQILLQIGMGYEASAQLAALLRHRLTLTGSGSREIGKQLASPLLGSPTL